jgi:hypothetical protein
MPFSSSFVSPTTLEDETATSKEETHVGVNLEQAQQSNMQQA